MAREHARIWLDINSDDDFESLTPLAQWFYLRVLLPDPTLSYCGVADWRPKRLVRKAAGLTVDIIEACAAECERKRYALFDLDTEEVLLRSYVRRDQLLRNPKTAAAVIKAYGSVASDALRAGVVTELKRIHKEHPEYSSWTSKDTAGALAELVMKPDQTVIEYAPKYTDIGNAGPIQIGNPVAVPITNRDAVENGNGEAVRITKSGTSPDYQSKSVRIPSTSTTHHSPAPLGGYVTGERHQGTEPDPNGPPPRYCPRHMPTGTDSACGDCRTQRRVFDHWLAEQTVERREAEQAKARAEAAARAETAAVRARAIAACGLCDDDGYTATHSVCDHVDRTDTNARGMAKVRAALAKETDQ